MRLADCRRPLPAGNGRLSKWRQFDPDGPSVPACCLGLVARLRLTVRPSAGGALSYSRQVGAPDATVRLAGCCPSPSSCQYIRISPEMQPVIWASPLPVVYLPAPGRSVSFPSAVAAGGCPTPAGLVIRQRQGSGGVEVVHGTWAIAQADADNCAWGVPFSANLAAARGSFSGAQPDNLANAEFACQGHVTLGGAPVNGPGDWRFTL
jgi:hypothetical protein